MAVKILASI